MRRLSSLDAQFLAAEHGRFGSQYCGMAIYETRRGEPISAATMKQRLSKRIHLCPPLRWKVVTVPLGLDHPVFVEAEVNLDEHVSESTLPAPADEATLAAEAARILATRLDRDKPLWRLHVFHGLPERIVVVITLHHAAADGIAAGEIFSALLDGGDDNYSAKDTSSDRARSAPSWALAARGLASLPLRAARAVRPAPGTLAHLDQVPAVRALPGVQTVTRLVGQGGGDNKLHAPRTRFNVKLSGNRAVGVGTVSLADVKAVKNRFGVTVNDVVIALCAGALRRRFAQTGDLPAEPLVAYIPVSTRSPDAADRFGNAISSIVAPIPTHLSEPYERLSFAHDILKQAKRRTSEASPTLLSDVNDPIPAPVFGVAARGLMEIMSSRFSRPPVNLVISNVAGSPAPLTCFGAPLLANYPLSLVFDGFALNITVVSYVDGLDIGIVGDAEALPDAWELIADFRAELAELSALVKTERNSDQ
jgi:WS/DGAT/MGAT family acyltransferase